MADASRRLGEPEIWKLFQASGTIEILTVLAKSKSSKLRLMDFQFALPHQKESTLRKRLNELIAARCLSFSEMYSPQRELVPWVFLQPRGAKLAEAALHLFDHASSYDSTPSRLVRELNDPLPDLPSPFVEDSVVIEDRPVSDVPRLTVEEVRRVVERWRRVPYQWRDQ